jgi:hypothetical protein
MCRRMRLALFSLAAIALACTSIPASAESHVRIVRLSYIDGQVQMDRATGSGIERAMLNSPVQEGARLVTADDGLAEVEFENGNSLRLAGNTEVRFSQLLMNDAGAKVNEITLTRGTVYLDNRAKGDDIYRLIADEKTFVPQRGAQFRLSASPDRLRLAVFKGEVHLAGPESLTVGKKETLTLDPQNAAAYELARTVESQPADAWNSEREAYAQTYAHNYGYGGPGSGYGLQDLNYYGDFSYVPGYGYGWQPYGFSSAMMTFDPYSNGAWTFLPGAGYAFSSFYPWGWLPYHYGSWAYIGGSGWFWLPGSNYGNNWYNGFRSTPKIVKQPAGWTPATPPVVATASAAQPTVPLGKVTGSPAYIPGGRVPPNFASVIPGRSAHLPAATSFARSAVKTPASNESVFARSNASYVAGRSGKSGHVFAAPANSAASMSGYSAASSAMSGGGLGAHSESAGHASGAGHSSSGGHR